MLNLKISLILSFLISLSNITATYEDETISQEDLGTILRYIDEERADDPLVEIEPYIWVKKSNIDGIRINDETYYYSLAPHMSYDPLSRNVVDQNDIDILYKEEGDFPLLIYSIRHS